MRRQRQSARAAQAIHMRVLDGIAKSPQAAVQAARAGVQRFPRSICLRSTLAEMLLLAGDRVGARRILEEAALDDPECSQIWFGIGYLAARNGRRGIALECVRHGAALLRAENDAARSDIDSIAAWLNLPESERLKHQALLAGADQRERLAPARKRKSTRQRSQP